MRRSILAAFCCTFFMAACAAHHPAQMGVDANYSLEVTNPTTAPISVQLDMGAGQLSALGEVAAGQTRTFEIRNPSTSEVAVIYSDTNGGNVRREKIQLSRSKTAVMTAKATQ